MPAFAKRWLVLGGIVVIPLIALGLAGPPSPSGWAYLGSFLLLWLGPAFAYRAPRFRRVLQWSGVGLFLLVACLRCARSEGALRYTQVGEPSLARRVLARMADERDLSLAAVHSLNAVHALPPRARRLPGLFELTYDAIGKGGPTPASALLPTLLLGQSADSFDMLHDALPAPRGTLVFLHGFGGNISAICWELAQSARLAGFETRCPSTTTAGRWRNEEGEAILRRTLEDATRPTVLVGLSNGADGAAILAPKVRDRIDGLILISGAARAPRSGVRTLVIYGRNDRMFRPGAMREYVARTGARSLVFDGGHFVVLGERARIRPAIARFLRSLSP